MITGDQIQHLKSLLQSGADMDFFFSSIKSPEWLPTLLEHGFFNSPPEPVRSGGWVQYPPWPQSRYLARVAAQLPETAVKAALHIPPTHNLRVNDDIFGVALAVPPPLAAKLLPRITEWVKNEDLRWMANDVADVIAHTASADFKNAANLLRLLISFTPDPDKKEKAKIRETGALVGWGLEPRSRLEVHDYQKLLTTGVPPLLREKPMESLSLLAGVLDRFIRDKMNEDALPGYDGSVYWRPSISASGQNPDHKPVSYLISALRDAGETAVNQGWITVDQLLSVVRKPAWHIFRRLELHWARIFLAQVDPDLVRRMVLTPDYFFSGNFDLEYGQLLRGAFPLLTPEQQTQIFQWTEQGPRAEDLAWMTKDAAGEPVSDEIIAGRIAYWRVNRLFWIKDALPPAWRARYDQWVAQSREPEHPGFHVWSGGVEVGVRSPLTAEDFRAMTLPQQLEFLRTWKPKTRNWNGPMQEGLAGTLQAAVKAQPVHFFENADQFIAIDSIYLSGLLRGFIEGLKDQAVGKWQPFWKLARWILDQPDPEADLPDEFTGRSRPGRRWLSCRLEIARFVDALLKGDLVKLPLAERASAWEVVERLTHDPNPTLDDEARDGETNMDPFSLSLNTVRGEAVHAVFNYIRWVRSSLPEDQRGAQTLDDLPEVRATLEWLLDPQVEPTMTVRSVFGVNITPLSFWAEKWLRENLGRIFPTKEHDDLWKIAWETFIGFSRAHHATLTLLHDQYATAIARMSQDPKDERRHEDARVSLGQHLIINYWWGHLDFEKPDDLLATFFARAPETVRAKVMSFVGRSVAQSGEPIPPDIHARLVKFWNWRVAQAMAAKSVGFQDELANFAWWFDSKNFDDAWAAQQMIVALDLSHATDSQFLWMRRFAEIAEQYPAEAVRALELTVQTVQQKAGQFWEDEEAAIIFSAAKKLGDRGTLQRARRAQNVLLGMGKSQFLHALPLADPQ